jgi:hypothetical protein
MVSSGKRGGVNSGERQSLSSNGQWDRITPLTCFTEIRLSVAETHARRYGLAGIGVGREYVLRRHGGPVHYVRSKPGDAIVSNFIEVQKLFVDLQRRGHLVPGKERPMELLTYLASHLRAMSEGHPDAPDDFHLLEESEWRIVWTQLLRDEGLDGKLPSGQLVLPVDPDDVSIIVLPNDETRTMLCGNDLFQNWSLNRRSPVPLLTLLECSQF